jgi:hypothetical protein
VSRRMVQENGTGDVSLRMVQETCLGGCL